MSTTVAALVAALLALAPLTASAAPDPTLAPDPPHVLIVGDSVTQGYRGDYTWRYFLWRALQERGTSVDLVGRRTGTFDSSGDPWTWDYEGTDAYADPAFDQDHSAWWGGRLSPVENGLHDPIGEQVTAHAADVVVSMWGINDLQRADTGPADLIASYRDWFAMAREANPDVDFVVARLPYTWLYDDEVVDFNALVGDLAAELTTERSRINVATMTESYTQESDSYDHVHPNTSGQRKIAAMIGGALLPLVETAAEPGPIPVPAAPAPIHITIPAAVTPTVAAARPAAPRRVRAERFGRRVVVRWARSSAVEAYVVRCGGRKAATTGRRVVLRSRSTTCSVRALGEGGASPWARTRVKRSS